MVTARPQTLGSNSKANKHKRSDSKRASYKCLVICTLQNKACCRLHACSQYQPHQLCTLPVTLLPVTIPSPVPHLQRLHLRGGVGRAHSPCSSWRVLLPCARGHCQGLVAPKLLLMPHLHLALLLHIVLHRRTHLAVRVCALLVVLQQLARDHTPASNKAAPLSQPDRALQHEPRLQAGAID